MLDLSSRLMQTLSEYHAGKIPPRISRRSRMGDDGSAKIGVTARVIDRHYMELSQRSYKARSCRLCVIIADVMIGLDLSP